MGGKDFEEGRTLTSMQDMGKVMGVLKNSIPAGTADMGIVSKIVKDNLS